MRNTVLMLLGHSFESWTQKLMKYTLQYGEAQVTDYLQVAFWQPADVSEPHVMTTALCQRAQKKVTEFCSDLSDEYMVEMDKGQQLTSDQEVRQWWTDLFGRTVTLHHQGESSGLHLCLVVKLWDGEMVDEVLRIGRCLKGLSHKYVVDVLGVPPSLATVFDDEMATTAQMAAERKQIAQQNLSRLVEAKHADKTLHAIVMFEGTNTEGVALNMDADTWLRLVGEYALIATENYLTLFPHNANVQETDCTTFGVSILHFDKFYFIHYLLRRAYLKILGREQVQQKEVDVNKVANIAQEQLLKHYHKFTEIYEKEVKPMLAQGKSEKTILSQITERVNAETDEMVRDFQSFIDSEEISLPEKQATLAQLLGLNDELYVGNLFARDQKVFEDCGSDAIATFVDENNALEDVGVLTAPRDKETDKVFSPIDQLKASRLRIMESDRYIRTKTEELEQWQKQIDETQESEKRLTNEGFVYGDVTYRFMSDAEVRLFEDNYEPRPVTVDSVDMRPMFTAVRNQGELGACTVFAMVGVYEYLLKKLQMEKTDLSEHFVYYNVSVGSDGEPVDDGSSLFAVATSMSEHGICLEELCRYDSTLSRPSQEAYEEAQNHLVKKVKNVPIGADQTANHKAITSALAEGYPVIISLKLYDSFGTGIRGFVSRPTPEEKQQDKHGNHAMVLCGFSDEEKVYIVRNSWGTDFGDQGYCYIPYSYVDDSAFCNQACIITHIAESEKLDGWGEQHVQKVSFSTTDASIRYAIARNLIEEEKVKMRVEQMVYQQLATAYYRLVSDLGNNSVRRQILNGAEERLKKEIEEKKEERDTFVKVEYVNALQQVKAETKSGTIVIVTFLAAWLLVLSIFLSYQSLRTWADQDFWVTMSVIGGIIAIVLIWYLYYRRSVYNNKERQLNHHRDQLAMNVKRLEKELSSMHLKLHIAGMFVEAINKVQHVLDHKYKLLKGYVGNLAQWMTDEKATIGQMEVVEKVPFVPIIQNAALDRYFSEHEEQITESVHLYSFLDEVGLSDDDIVQYKYRVRNKIAETLSRQYDNFSILEYVMGQTRYAYLPQESADIASLMYNMDRQSDCFMQLANTGKLDAGILSRYVLVHAKTDALRKDWQAEYPRHFQHKPSDVGNFSSPSRLIELQVRHLPMSQIEWMRKED